MSYSTLNKGSFQTEFVYFSWRKIFHSCISSTETIFYFPTKTKSFACSAERNGKKKIRWLAEVGYTWFFYHFFITLASVLGIYNLNSLLSLLSWTLSSLLHGRDQRFFPWYTTHLSLTKVELLSYVFLYFKGKECAKNSVIESLRGILNHRWRKESTFLNRWNNKLWNASFYLF